MFFQGEPGAFSEAAIRRYFPDGDATGLGSFKDVFDALRQEPAAVGLLPIENAYRGSVYDVWDLLVASPTLTIWAEVVQPVTLALMVVPGETMQTIRRVRSHPQALMQSRGFWQPRGWEADPALDTAGSARELSQHRWPGVAAIAHPRAAELYGLTILASPIEDYADNRTRFWLLSQTPPPVRLDNGGGLMKATLAFDIAHRPGTLARVLTAFYEHGLNLTKIESRPRPGTPFEFRFWVDLGLESPEAVHALKTVVSESGLFEWHRLLGIYPVMPGP
ncbi:prephenate dehydratase [Sulfobacillus acidophilus TPY]|uniref:Prephenate dehydratase n=1 Tax=Sulfobacillus acidophilus (strain ATCC 700253 / DSM 10332 / NAL) TaxID=679936 RepID=G8TVU8_SULAD|nr:prephenate dehydratase [Sulfobacillus acidophilus TPY]AEW04792.1 prephenate dehydratase [Sulfobacillus acidophilus DSM 10332]